MVNNSAILCNWGVYDILEYLSTKYNIESYLCVGVQEGNCLKHVLSGSKIVSKLLLCDTWGSEYGGTNRGNHDHITTLLNKIGYKGKVIFLDGDSIELIPIINDDVYDLSFVDGNHSEEHALSDMVNVWKLTKMVMIVHDIRMVDVWSALTKFLDTVASCVRVEFTTEWTGTAIVYRVG